MKVLFHTSKYIVVSVIILLTTHYAYSQALSDRQVKINIRPISNPLTVIKSLEPKMFEYNSDRTRYLRFPDGTQYGFIAEDFKKILPELIVSKKYTYMKGKNNFEKASLKVVQMEYLVPLLVASIKEQQVIIEQLRSDLDEIKKKSKSVKVQ